QTAWITRHAEFLPDPDRNAQPNKRLELFFRHALSGLIYASLGIYTITSITKATRRAKGITPT
ncbi:MAG: hypothetical protein V4584_13880, partial [Verrucomicrobiota bacterium]